MKELDILNSKIKELQDLKDNGTIPLFADGMLKAYDDLQPLVKKLIIANVVDRSIEFAKYASTYYKVCYEKEPMWLNRNNHKRFTSSEVYENFIKYTNNVLQS